MNETTQKSCWGFTTWAVAGIACVMVIAWLLGTNGADVAAASLAG